MTTFDTPTGTAPVNETHPNPYLRGRVPTVWEAERSDEHLALEQSYAEMLLELASIEAHISRAVRDGDAVRFAELASRHEMLPKMLEAVEAELLRLQIEHLQASQALTDPHRRELRTIVAEKEAALRAARDDHRTAATAFGAVNRAHRSFDFRIQTVQDRLAELVGVKSATRLIDDSIERANGDGRQPPPPRLEPVGDRHPGAFPVDGGAHEMRKAREAKQGRKS